MDPTTPTPSTPTVEQLLTELANQQHSGAVPVWVTPLVTFGVGVLAACVALWIAWKSRKQDRTERVRADVRSILGSVRTHLVEVEDQLAVWHRALAEEIRSNAMADPMPDTGQPLDGMVEAMEAAHAVHARARDTFKSLLAPLMRNRGALVILCEADDPIIEAFDRLTRTFNQVVLQTERLQWSWFWDGDHRRPKPIAKQMRQAVVGFEDASRLYLGVRSPKADPTPVPEYF